MLGSSGNSGEKSVANLTRPGCHNSGVSPPDGDQGLACPTPWTQGTPPIAPACSGSPALRRCFAARTKLAALKQLFGLFRKTSTALRCDKRGFGLLLFCCSLPLAAAGGEWMNVDQQGQLFERSEFCHCRRSSFRLREPCAAGQGLRARFGLTFGADQR